jgi:hypothetical protein
MVENRSTDSIELLLEQDLPKLNEIEELECSVCYNKIGETNKCVTPCGHLFCFKCIHKVIKKGNDSCPNCRSLFTEETSSVENINNNLYDEEDDENILNNNILNNNNIFNNMFSIFDNDLINEDVEDDTLSNTLSLSTSISDIPDEELYNDDNYFINPKLINLCDDEHEPFNEISKIVSILLEKGFNETDIKYIIRKNFNYNILTEEKECDNQDLIFSNQTIENINVLQNELNKIICELKLEITNNSI